jgi:ATP-dependent DNA helicase DinG
VTSGGFGRSSVYSAMPAAVPLPTPTTRLAPAAALAIRAAIRLAGDREVCFVGTVDDDNVVQSARVVARGDTERVLALPGFAERGDILLHNHPSGVLDPSDADLTVAARLHDDGIGFAIVDNAATRLYVVVEVPRRRARLRVEPDEVSQDLGPAGPIAAALPRYEDRPSQRAMAAEVARLYNEGGVGLLEAGTGVGKSLGYLVPALRWAAANGERTVVSTNTINLQEQLVGKDLPFLAGALTDQKVRFALLKGWGNYLCLYRLEQARASGAALFEPELGRELDVLQSWAERTVDGSKSDLPVSPRQEVWDEVVAEPDLCLRLKCPLYDRCFVFAARRAAAEADVVVVNHHLLLSDVAVRRVSHNWEDSAVLPAYKRLVVDEGHHLEDAAAAHLGSVATRRSVHRLLNRLDRKGKGLLNALAAKLAASDDLLSAASFELVTGRLAPAVHAARAKSDVLFDLLDTFLLEAGQAVVRLTDDFADHRIWKAGLEVALEDTLNEIAMLEQGLGVVRERIESSAKLDEAATPLLNEMRAVARRLQGLADALCSALRPPPGEPSVRWVEVKGKERVVSVSSVPLDLAPILREDLFKRVATTVVTSATLAADSSFSFLARRLGVDDPALRLRTGLYPSPFRYREQAVLVVASDVPAPNQDAAGHSARVVRMALDLSATSDGGIFVLFTSHRDVRLVAAELRARGVDRRWPLLVHGEEQRDVLLARFREAGRAILLGTASFWEGVDVPGEALRGLLISKLPFRVPTEPVTAAHCEAIERRGGNAFDEYMVPHASLRLKQGFGRLIRTATDRGVVVVADPRIVSKGYGRRLIQALPPARRVVARWSDALVEIREFYHGGAQSSASTAVAACV